MSAASLVIVQSRREQAYCCVPCGCRATATFARLERLLNRLIFTRPPFAPTLCRPTRCMPFAAVKVTAVLHSCCNGSQAGPELQRPASSSLELRLRDTEIPSVRGVQPTRGIASRRSFSCVDALGYTRVRAVEGAATAANAGTTKSMSGSGRRALRRRRLRWSDEFARCRVRVARFERERDAGRHEQEGRECVRRGIEVTQCCHQGDKRATNILEFHGLGALHESPKP